MGVEVSKKKGSGTTKVIKNKFGEAKEVYQTVEDLNTIYEYLTNKNHTQGYNIYRLIGDVGNNQKKGIQQRGYLSKYGKGSFSFTDNFSHHALMIEYIFLDKNRIGVVQGVFHVQPVERNGETVAEIIVEFYDRRRWEKKIFLFSLNNCKLVMTTIQDRFCNYEVYYNVVTKNCQHRVDEIIRFLKQEYYQNHDSKQIEN